MNATDGKNGNYGFHITSTVANDGDVVEFDSPIFVMVHDNSTDSLSAHELRKIADVAIHQQLYWNDVESYYWMYDFKVWDHWCEMVHERVTGESIYDCMHINVE
jgi:hypothetical protein